MADPGQRPLIAGRYRLGSRLGRGGMAEVFDAFDERLERPVALKVLRSDVAADDGMRQRFEAEARAAARLSHPAVVSVYDSGEHQGRAFLIMERLPGETLADRIRQGPVDQAWLKRAAADVLSALGAAHEIGLIHRDIKPGNVLITEDDRVKVADFGIAKMTVGAEGDADLTQVGMVLGTPAYLAPERLAGEPATVSTDLYAVGVVLYEAATGHKPAAGSADATVLGTRADPAASPNDPPLDPALARVIRRAMAPRPAERYPSAEAMAADLGRAGAAVPPTVAMAPTTVAEGTRVLPPTTARPVAIEEKKDRRPLIIAALLIAALIIVIIIVLVATHGGGGNSPSSTTSSTATTVAPTSTTGASSTTAPPTTATPTTAKPTTTTTSTLPATTSTTARPTTTSSPSSTDRTTSTTSRSGSTTSST